MSYVKLFSSILDSTIWREDNETRILWLTMLAMADRDGIIEASLPGLADRARLTRDQVVTGLAKLQAPDPDSRSPVADGRRIEKIEGGWALINFEYYRDKQSAEDVRAKAAERQRRKRARDLDKAAKVPECKDGDCGLCVPCVEARGEDESKDTKKAKKTHPCEVCGELRGNESMARACAAVCRSEAVQ